MTDERKQRLLCVISDDNGQYYYNGPIDGTLQRCSPQRHGIQLRRVPVHLGDRCMMTTMTMMFPGC